MDKKIYPDISDIIARKEEARHIAAKRSFSEKIDWLERAREELRPFAQLRELRAQKCREDEKLKAAR